MPSDKPSTLVGPIRSAEGHLVFPSLLVAETGGKFPSNKFVTTFLIPKTSSVEELVAACLKASQLEWPTLGITSPTQIKLPIRKGSEKPGWEEFLFLKCKSKNKPPIVDAAKAPYSGPIKGGDICRLALTAMPYKAQLEAEVAEALRAQGKLVQVGIIDGKNVSWRPATTFLLNGVQFLKSHDPIGAKAGVDGTSAFEAQAASAAKSASDDLFN